MLASSSEYRHGNMVFFDVLGLLVIAYPSRVGSIINYMVVMAVVLYLGKKLLRPKHSKSFPLKCGSGMRVGFAEEILAIVFVSSRKYRIFGDC